MYFPDRRHILETDSIVEEISLENNKPRNFSLVEHLAEIYCILGALAIVARSLQSC